MALYWSQGWSAQARPPGWLVAPSDGWQVSNGFFQTNESSPGYKVAVVSHCNESMNIDATVGRVWPDGETSISGILFKAQFAGNGISGYFAGYNTYGVFVLLRFDNYNLVGSGGTFAQLCGKNVSIGANGALNKIKLITRGGKHKVFFNGTAVCNVTDYTYGTGLAGALAFFDGGGNDFAVDSFIITPQVIVPKAKVSSSATEQPDEDDPVVESSGATLTLAR